MIRERDFVPSSSLAFRCFCFQGMCVIISRDGTAEGDETHHSPSAAAQTEEIYIT